MLNPFASPLSQLRQANLLLTKLQLPAGVSIVGGAFFNNAGELMVQVANDQIGASLVIPFKLLTKADGTLVELTKVDSNVVMPGVLAPTAQALLAQKKIIAAKLTEQSDETTSVENPSLSYKEKSQLQSKSVLGEGQESGVKASSSAQEKSELVAGEVITGPVVKGTEPVWTESVEITAGAVTLATASANDVVYGRAEDQIVPAESRIYSVRLSVSSGRFPELLGRFSQPSGVVYLQKLLAPMIAERETTGSPVIVLTQDSPLARTYFGAVRQKIENALRNWERNYSRNTPDLQEPLHLVFEAVDGGLRISFRPHVRDVPPASLSTSGDLATEDANPFDTLRRFTGLSLSALPSGPDGLRREDELSVESFRPLFVPYPMALIFRASLESRVNPSLGQAAVTDDAIARVARRSDSSRHRDEERGGSRGGRNGQQNGRQDDEQEPQNPNEDKSAAA